MNNNIILENKKKMEDINTKLFYSDKQLLLKNLKRIEQVINKFIRKNNKIKADKNTELRSLLSKLDLLVYLEYANNKCELKLRRIIDTYLKNGDISVDDINTVLKYFKYSEESKLKLKHDFNDIILSSTYGYGNFNVDENEILNVIQNLGNVKTKGLKLK